MANKGCHRLVPVQKGERSLWFQCKPFWLLTLHVPQTKTIPIALTLNPQGDAFAVLSVPNLALTTFNFSTGKRHRQYDESLAAISEMQQAAAGDAKLDSMEFGRRLAVERELERQAVDGVKEGRIGAVGMGTPAWDESGKMVLYPTLLGIKVVNTVTNKVVRMLGKDETIRFLNLALYQGLPIKAGFTTIVSHLHAKFSTVRH